MTRCSTKCNAGDYVSRGVGVLQAFLNEHRQRLYDSPGAPVSGGAAVDSLSGSSGYWLLLLQVPPVVTGSPPSLVVPDGVRSYRRSLTLKPSLPFYRSNMKEGKGNFSVTCFIKRLLLVSRTDLFSSCYLCSHVVVGEKCGAINVTTGCTESVVTLTFIPQSACQSVCCSGNQVFVATLIWPSENILYDINRLADCTVSGPVEPVFKVDQCVCMLNVYACFNNKFRTWGIAVAL